MAAEAEARPGRAAMGPLLALRGIGPGFAGVPWSEGPFRRLDNRRRWAACAGPAPTPWQSGSVSRGQGVSKAGTPRLRATLAEMACLRLRHRPGSAPARKPLVALCKPLAAGVVIEGVAVTSA